MSDIEDQPAPVKNDLSHVADLVMADIVERKRIGVERYGVALQPFNRRNALIDAYQEALDLCMYLRQKIEEEVIVTARARKACTCGRGGDLCLVHDSPLIGLISA